MICKVKRLLEAAGSLLLRGCVILNSHISSKAVIRKKCRVYNSTIGDYSYVTRGTLIQNTKIGKFCSVSENCMIGTPSHPTDMVSTSPVFLEGKNYLKVNFASIPYRNTVETVIGNDVWIGANCLIKAGVSIGDGAVIGMGAVVTKNVEPYSIVAGVPARLLRKRFDDDTVKKLLTSKWWSWPDDKLERYGKAFASTEEFFNCLRELEE